MESGFGSGAALSRGEPHGGMDGVVDFWARSGFGKGRGHRGACLGRGGRELEFGLFGFRTLVLLQDNASRQAKHR